MNIEISAQTARNIQAALGTSDPAIISGVVERMVADEKLVKSFLEEPPSEDQRLESLRLCDQGMEEIARGEVRPAKEAIGDLATRHGLKIEP